jgi:hypothetical protein
LDAHRQITGRPILRMPIDDVGAYRATVGAGDYYVSILNDGASPVVVTYRVRATAF